MLAAFPRFDLVRAAHEPAMHRLPNTIAEERFDRVTRIAARSFNMPMALFTLVDARRCWCKSQIGLTTPQAAGLALLGHDILSHDGPLVVTGPHLETRSDGVATDTDVRFYAGIPVRGPDGIGIGALCVLDQHPRQLDAPQLALLADLAALLERELAVDQLEQRLAHEDHHESMRGLLDYVPEAVLMLSPDGTIVACNAVAEGMYGAALNGLVGRHGSELTGEDPTRLRLALNAGERNALQAIARRIDGSEFIAEFSAKVFDSSTSRRYALAVRDISKRMEQERTLRDADARRREYFVTATHELRTPMASVLGFSELLLKRKFDGVERREMMEIIHRQASQLVALINEMLDLARIESGGKKALDLRSHNAEAILEQTLSGLEGLGATQRIVCAPAPDLPLVLADAMKLQQALTNIISNAVKYSKAFSEIRIDVFETQLGAVSAVAFEITDQGIGMTADEKAQVFNPFYRASTKSETIGTGLGMTICKEIVALHGGCVQIESTAGMGTTITLLLPAAPAAV